MTEGKTNMFGKAYNTIGSTDSNFIIKTKGDLKVLWGNKYIDVIKNGKIASSGSAIIKAVATIEDIKKDGIYLVGEDLIWVSVDGNNINVSLEGSNVYVSFLVEQTNTADEKYRALTNIGFYYNTLEEAQSVISGIIYVEETLKLYIVNKGQLTPYTTGELETIINEDDSVTNVFEELLIGNLHLYNKNDYGIIDSATKMQISIKDIPYITLENGTVNLLVSLNVPPNLYLLSLGASKDTGFRLYTDGGESTLEIDNLIWRNYPIPVTFSELDSMIKEERLKPKMWYNITDFLNPWEVTWKDEPIYYEDQYTDIEEEPHLCGKRNAMLLIILAKNNNTLEQRAYSLLNPDWVIYYDPTYKGPEHTVDNNTVYGFRSRIEDGETVYLPCKGRITYLKDEFGNEGNFNFRQFMFKHSQGYWRYCADSIIGNDLFYFGEFLKCYNNIFNFDALSAYILVFKFSKVLGPNGEVINYSVEAIDSNVKLSNGHHVFINALSMEGNEFKLQDMDNNIQHIISSLNIQGNTFINIEDSIMCQHDIKNNYFENIKGSININTECEGNTIINIKDNVIIEKNTVFNNNNLSNFEQWLINEKIFERNTIKLNTGSINNSVIMQDNIINSVTGTLLNNNLMSGNTIEIVKNITNNNTIENNNIGEIKSDIINEGIITNNTFRTIDILNNNGTITNNNIINFINISNDGTINGNIIDSIKELINGGTFSDNIILESSGIIHNTGEISLNDITIIFKNLTNTVSFSANTIYSISSDLSNDYGFINNNINDILELTIYADILNNIINNILKCSIKGNTMNNLFTDIVNTTFNADVKDNIVRDIILDSEFGIFTDNKVYKSLTKFYFSGGNINSCIFNKPISQFIVLDIIQSSTFNYIDNLTLDKPVYYTTFHGYIGNINKELTDYEWELLSDATKKTDAYPNIRVVCVPEIIKKGMILMWYGLEEIPKGWALCDGNNGTPNLIDRFIKASDSVGEVDPEGIEWDEDKVNTLKLKAENLPEHHHPHKKHKHYFEGSGSDTITDDYASYNSLYNVNEGEGSSTTSGENWSSPSETETISINISGYTSEEISEEDKWQYGEILPIKIEPKHYKLIFIMKIDENPLLG